MVVVIFVVIVVFVVVVIEVITVMVVVVVTVVVVLDALTLKGINVEEGVVDLRVGFCDSVVIMKEKLDNVFKSGNSDVKQSLKYEYLLIIRIKTTLILTH